MTPAGLTMTGTTALFRSVPGRIAPVGDTAATGLQGAPSRLSPFIVSAAGRPSLSDEAVESTREVAPGRGTSDSEQAETLRSVLAEAGALSRRGRAGGAWRTDVGRDQVAANDTGSTEATAELPKKNGFPLGRPTFPIPSLIVDLDRGIAAYRRAQSLIETA